MTTQRKSHKPTEKPAARRQPGAPQGYCRVWFEIPPGKDFAWLSESGTPTLEVVRERGGALSLGVHVPRGRHHGRTRYEVRDRVQHRLIVES
jgi:hypothetical protein